MNDLTEALLLIFMVLAGIGLGGWIVGLLVRKHDERDL